MKNQTSSRQIAFELLQQVLLKSQPLELSMERHSDFHKLTGQDKAFVRMIISTACRRLGQIDDCIRRASGRPIHDITPKEILIILRLAMAQLLFMQTSDYAVCDTAVQLAKDNHAGRGAGFVNAVLRKTIGHRQDWLSKQDAGRLNTPDWLMAEWIEDYGLSVAAQIAEANMAEAAIDISVKDDDQVEDWAEKIGARILPTGQLRLAQEKFDQKENRKTLTQLPGFYDGAWWVQDVSAALPARLFGDISGQHVVDLCAAPGGKTMQLAAFGAEVTTLDRSAARLKRLEENIGRTGFKKQVRVEIADAAVWQPPQKLGYVLLDAPCSATGTIRRHPDVMHLKSKQDLEKLQNVQQRILRNAYKMLKSGGVLIYCTCSLQKSEGELQINTFLSDHSDMQRFPISELDTGELKALITQDGDVRCMPFHLAAEGGMDGFYIARLIKS